MFSKGLRLLAVLILVGAVTSIGQQPAPPVSLAHFHHVQLNSTDPAAAIDFYTSKFDCEKARFAGKIDAVWAQKSWLFFNKRSEEHTSELQSHLNLVCRLLLAKKKPSSVEST